MNNKVYLIHEEDYIKHIDEKVLLYSFVKQLVHCVGRMKTTGADDDFIKWRRVTVLQPRTCSTPGDSKVIHYA